MIQKRWTMGSKNAKKSDLLHDLQKVTRHIRLIFALITVKAIHIMSLVMSGHDSKTHIQQQPHNVNSLSFKFASYLWRIAELTFLTYYRYVG